MVKLIDDAIDFDFEIEELEAELDGNWEVDDDWDIDEWDAFDDEDDEDDDLVVFGRLDELDWEIDLLDDEV